MRAGQREESADGRIDRYVGQRVRARDGAGLSLHDLAQAVGHDADALAAIEEGRASATAADLVRLSLVLHTSVGAFLPGVSEADLNDSERALLALFRQLDGEWQANVIESLRAQVALIDESRAIATLPDAERRDATYRALARYLLDSGARAVLGRPRHLEGATQRSLRMDERERRPSPRVAYRLQREDEERERPEPDLGP